MVEDLQINDVVVTRYKTGKYIGKIIDWRGEDKAIVEVLAVLEHPKQGDLHNPNQVDVMLFHQRKALAHHEKAVVNTHSLKLYTEEVPEYDESLRKVLDRNIIDLKEEGSVYAEKALAHLLDLKKEYFRE